MTAVHPISPERRGASLPPLRRMRRLLFYGSVRGLVALVQALPRGAAEVLLRSLGGIAWRMRPSERQRAVRQLAWAFPDRDETWCRDTARHALERLGENLVDMVRRERRLSLEPGARAQLDQMRAEGRPVLVLMAHLGAWERLGPLLAEALPPFGAITADPHNARLDRWLRKRRAALGVRSFDRRREVRAAARWLRSGSALAVLADHRSAVSTVAAPWFGRQAPTVVGPVRLARAARARVLPVGIQRDGSGHRVFLGESFEVGAEESDRSAATRMNRALEAMIARAPEEWTWFHDRYGGEAGEDDVRP